MEGEQETKKVVVLGGAGQAGRIHVRNMKSLGAHVASHDMVENPECEHNFSPKTTSLKELKEQGYNHCVIALPDTMLYDKYKEAVAAGIYNILLEKPGGTSVSQLETISMETDGTHGPSLANVYMNYQRAFDPRFAELITEVETKCGKGYSLDYVSVYSCDSALPPQAAHQVLNQGCHDYNLFFSIIDAAQHRLEDIQSRGVKWHTLEDTKFLKISGSTVCFASPSEYDEEEEEEEVDQPTRTGLYDIMMGRVNAGGAFTELYVKMSKYDKKMKMYQPFEQKLRFPEQPDPNASWAEVWADTFKRSDEIFLTEDDGVYARDGARVLRFADMAKKSLEEGGKIIDNDYAC